MQSNRYSRPISVKLEFSQQFFEKHANTKFHANHSRVTGVIPWGDGWTDGHDRTNRVVAFRNFANAAKNGTRLRLQTYFSL